MYRDDKWVIPCITGRGAMCSGICHLYKYSSFPNPKPTTWSSFFCTLTNVWVACEPWQEPTAETRRSRSTTPQQQGYWEHWGWTGRDKDESPLQQRAQPMSTLKEFKGQSWPLYCTCPKERWEVKGGRWGWATSGTQDSLSRFGISLSKGRKHVSV